MQADPVANVTWKFQALIYQSESRRLPCSFRRKTADPVDDTAEHHRLHEGVGQAQQGSGQGRCPGLQSTMLSYRTAMSAATLALCTRQCRTSQVYKQGS